MIVEISGIKLDVDERTARTVESYKVGDRVKCLVKHYGDSWSVYPGVIVGFAPFVRLPTIEIMYLDSDTLKFKAVNAKSEDFEIAPLNEAELILDKGDTIRRLDREIERIESDLVEKRQKRAYFIERFATAFRGDPVESVS